MNRLAEGGELTAVEQAVTIGERLRHCWFRGQSKAVGVLLPGAHREPFWSGRIEFWAGQRFRLRASAYTNDVPRWGDHVSWLFWAQHYGVPTRLLDWTENILVALYFAVTGGEASDDGELWCMNHQELKWRSADYKACFPDSPPIRYLAAAAFLRLEDLTEFKSAFGTTTINGPLALIPPLQFPLMAAQMSRFTIHPSREPEAQIEFLLRSASSLIRYVIPSASKNTLARDLRGIGVSHENLYRGLDSLARSIREEIIESDFYIEDPPRFDNNSSSTRAYGGIDAQTTGTNRFANRKSGKCRYQCGIFS